MAGHRQFEENEGLERLPAQPQLVVADILSAYP
jgi:hypothetical protein